MYGSELAEIYDLIHEGRGKDYHAEAWEVLKRVAGKARQASSLLDVACGTGAHLRHFATFVDRVEGLELSESMLAVAKSRMPDVPLHHGDMRHFDLGRTFDVITCMFGSIGYLRSTGELTAVLTRFARHLTPGGVLAIDPWWFAETFLDGYISADVVTTQGRTIARVSHSAREGDASRVDVHYTVADVESGARHFIETHLITLFTRAQYEAAFTRAGLAVDYVGGIQSGRGLFLGAHI